MKQNRFTNCFKTCGIGSLIFRVVWWVQYMSPPCQFYVMKWNEMSVYFLFSKINYFFKWENGYKFRMYTRYYTKTSPLLKTPEKDFHWHQYQLIDWYKITSLCGELFTLVEFSQSFLWIFSLCVVSCMILFELEHCSSILQHHFWTDFFSFFFSFISERSSSNVLKALL